MNKKRVLLITEYLNPPYDEGIKKTVYNLFLELEKSYELHVICRYGLDKENIHIVNTNPLFFSRQVQSIIKGFTPDSLIYLPFQSSTFTSYLRLKVLSMLSKSANNIFIALQPKPLKNWQRFIVKFIKPQASFTPSPDLKQYWDSINIENKLIPLLTDLSIFKSIKNSLSKQDLRKKYNLPVDAFIITHMGHLNEGRNLRSLIPLQKAGNQVIVIGSSSTPKDALGSTSLKESLLKEGIIVLDIYIEHIEEIYQLSDIYIFPVIAKTGSIGMPLSIMEARACGIPVITTVFGSLKHYLGNDSKSIWYCKPEEFLTKVKEIQTLLPRNFKQTNVKDINKEFYSIIHSAINCI